MKTGLSASVLLNIILLVVILVLRECGTKPEQKPETKPAISYDTDTITVAGKDRWYPFYTEHTDTIPDTTFINLKAEDSARIIADFCKIRNYDIPIVDDTNAKLNFQADVQFNKIKRWNISGDFYSHTKIIDNTKKPRTKLFVGIRTGMALNSNDLILAPTITLLTKRDHLYSIDYDPLNRIAGLSVQWKIKIKQ